MSTAKTAISLNTELLQETDELAKKTKNSRSGIISLALKEYLHRLKQEEILSQLDRVYEGEIEEESKLVDAGKDYFAQEILEDEEW